MGSAAAGLVVRRPVVCTISPHYNSPHTKCIGSSLPLLTVSAGLHITHYLTVYGQNQVVTCVPWRLFLAAQQRIAITWKPK